MVNNLKYFGLNLNNYQNDFVQNFLNINSQPNHLLLASTGSGKTVVSSVIIGEMIKSGSSRILVLVPFLVLAEQYKKNIEEYIENGAAVILDRKMIREMEAMNQENAFLLNTIAIVTWESASKSDVNEKIFSTTWDLIVAETGHLNVGTKRAKLFNELVKNLTSSRSLFVADLFDGASIKRILGESYKKIVVTKWDLKEFHNIIHPIHEIRLVNLQYERTIEEVDFIERYISLSKWLSNQKVQNKIRNRLVSSSFYAAEEGLRFIRNRVAHGNISSLLAPQEKGQEFIKDEELIGDINTEVLNKKFSEKDIEKFMAELSMTLDYLDQIQIDSKLFALRKAVINFHNENQRTWIYSSYKSTISYINRSLAQIVPSIFEIHGQMPTYQITEALNQFKDHGGILVSSTNRLKGLVLPIDNIILYDIPENENTLYVMLTRATITGSGKTINIVTLNDTSKAISSEVVRYKKFQEFMVKSIGIEI